VRRRGGGFPVIIVERVGDLAGADLAVDVEEMSAVLRSCVDND